MKKISDHNQLKTKGNYKYALACNSVCKLNLCDAKKKIHNQDNLERSMHESKDRPRELN